MENDCNESPPVRKKIPGFSKAQRRWFHERDRNRCAFFYWEEEKWFRCPRRDHLQIHHLYARGWVSLHFPDKDPNTPENGITLCSYHHVGYDAPNDEMWRVIHPDVEKARKKYQLGNKQAFQEMFEERARLNHLGIPYWNTMHDALLMRISVRHTCQFKKKFPYKNMEGYTHL